MQPEALAPDPASGPTAPPAAARTLSALQREMSTVLLIALIVVCAVLSPRFLSRTNLLNLADQLPVFGILAAGQMLVILSGGIDLSVGSAVALSAFFAAALYVQRIVQHLDSGPVGGLCSQRHGTGLSVIGSEGSSMLKTTVMHGGAAMAAGFRMRSGGHRLPYVGLGMT